MYSDIQLHFNIKLLLQKSAYVFLQSFSFYSTFIFIPSKHVQKISKFIQTLPRG